MENSNNFDIFAEYERVLSNPGIFESIVGLILQSLCNKEHKNIKSQPRIELQNKSVFYADYELEDGCDTLNLTKPTLVEVKFRLTDNSYNQFKTIVDHSDKALLVVTLEGVYVNLFDSVLKGRDITILTLGQLLEKVDRSNFPDLSDLYGIRQESETTDLYSFLESDPLKFNKDVIDKAINGFKNNNVTLFLGAGVGRSASLPTWDSLLQNILSDPIQRPLNKDDYPAIDVSSFNSPIITARHLFSPFMTPNKELDLVNLLKTSLYGDSKSYKSSLIKTIVAMCKTSKRGNKPLPKEGMSIITFNYDDLIETELENQKIDYQQIYGEAIYEKGKLPVIHVHGILRQNGPNTSIPVLSEKEYHQLYKSVFHWSNVEIEHALYRTTCLFIGLSMSDPNLRRLLEFVALENNNNLPHFAILPMRTLEDCNWESAYQTKYYKGNVNKEKHYIHRQEDVFRQLGINVIWYAGGHHEQIPLILKKIARIK